MLEEMHRNIVITLCMLETVFPPGFFNVVEYLPVHLAEEAQLGVQYNTDGFIHLRGKVECTR